MLVLKFEEIASLKPDYQILENCDVCKKLRILKFVARDTLGRRTSCCLECGEDIIRGIMSKHEEVTVHVDNGPEKETTD